MLTLPSRRDALPEFTAYEDRGCDLYPACLHCPLPRCRYETPGGAPAYFRVLRNAGIRQRRREGMGINELAEMFGVSRRSVFRALH